MNQIDLVSLIKNISERVQVDPNLVLAFAGHETNLDETKTRYEPRWRYFYTPNYFAAKLGISVETEKVLQAISWGPLQIMGAVSRECGYTGQLPLLIQPELSVLFSCRKIKSLAAIYSNEKDLISSYNCGKIIKSSDGTYSNQAYVDDVVNRLAIWRV